MGKFCFGPPPSSDQLIGRSWPASQAAPSPHPHSAMSPLRDFIATLAKAGKSFKDIQETVVAAYGDKSLKKTQIYAIIKNVKEGKPTTDQRKLNGKRKIRSPAFIANVAAAIEKDRRLMARRLATAHGVSKNTIHHTLKEDLNLSKKSARWVPKLLTEEMKKERVRASEAFLAMIHPRSMAMLENIVTMDESAVSFHTPEPKQQSKQWLKKGKPGPIKAKVHVTRAR